MCIQDHLLLRQVFMYLGLVNVDCSGANSSCNSSRHRSQQHLHCLYFCFLCYYGEFQYDPFSRIMHKPQDQMWCAVSMLYSDLGISDFVCHEGLAMVTGFQIPTAENQAILNLLSLRRLHPIPILYLLHDIQT